MPPRHKVRARVHSQRLQEGYFCVVGGPATRTDILPNEAQELYHDIAGRLCDFKASFPLAAKSMISLR